MSAIAKVLYYVNFKPVRVSKGDFETPPQIIITPEEYEVLRDAIVSERFVEIHGSLYNTGEIRSIDQRVPEPAVKPQDWMYENDDEFQKALDYWTKSQGY